MTAREVAGHAVARPDDVEHFERWSGSYDRSILQSLLFGPVQEAVLDAAAAELGTPRSILDVGCGTGRLLRRAAERFPKARLAGVDPARGMVAEARRAAPRRVRVEHGTAEALPFASGSFDLVVTTLSFHHWADQTAGLREMHRVVRPSGRVVVADATLPGLIRPLAAMLGLDHGLATTAALDEMLAGAGLALVRRSGTWRVPGIAISVAVRVPG